MSARLELEQLLEEMQKKGFQPIGLVFYAPKLRLLGIAPLEGVPDAFVEMIGQRLSGMKEGGGGWTGISGAEA